MTGTDPRAACLAVAVMLAACSPQPAAEPTPAAIAGAATVRPDVHPVSGLRIIDVTVTTDEERIGFAAELADTPQAQQHGLMFRTELDDFAAMIFPSDPPQERSFWMKNTPLPLDIIYIGTDGRILNMYEMTTPYSLDSLYSAGITSAVLEIRGGRARELGIEKGDLVEWDVR